MKVKYPLAMPWANTLVAFQFLLAFAKIMDIWLLSRWANIKQVPSVYFQLFLVLWNLTLYFSGLVTNKSKNGCPFLLFISSSLLHVCIYFSLDVHSFSHHLHLKKDRKEDCAKVRGNKWELVQISILRMRVVTVWTS